MTFTKLALSVLGTIGLTAGTVLAVAEPARAPLPAAIAQVSTGSCPGSACASGKCSAGACPTPAAVAAQCVSVEGPELKTCLVPPAQTEPIAAEVADDRVCNTPSSTCTSCNGPCGTTGHVVLTSAVSAEQCESKSCKVACDGDACRTAACEATCPVAMRANEETANAKKESRCITLGIGLSAGGPIIRLGAGSNDDATASSPCACSTARVAGQIITSLFQADAADACSVASGALTATACEAKPACATKACPTATCATKASPTATCATTSCPTTACDGNTAACEATVASANGESESCCTACDDCECGPCICPARTSKSEVVNSLFRIHHGADVIEMHSADIRIPTFPFVDHRQFHNEPIPGYHTYLYGSSPSEFGPPGRVRVSHLRPTEHDSRLDESHDLPPAIPPHLMPRIRLSGFAAPIAAPYQAPAVSPRLEGTWTRSTGDVTTRFTFHDGRVSGSSQVTNSIEIRFSGTCTTTRDNQFIGVIDEIEARGDDAENFRTHMLAQRLVDQPFAARFVADGSSLIIKDLRCSGIAPSIDDKDASTELLQYVRTFGCGRFERDEH